MFNANEVALWILTEAKKQHIFMTHMKLQKLLYYAQAYSIGITGKPLFHNSIMAWQHGPVVPDVYHSFSKFGNSLIHNVQDVSAPEPFDTLIAALVRDKGHLSAHQLRSMTHNEDTWRRAWNNTTSHKISDSMMADCFSHYFWTSDEEDDFQPSFSSVDEEEKFFTSNLNDDEINAIITSR